MTPSVLDIVAIVAAACAHIPTYTVHVVGQRHSLAVPKCSVLSWPVVLVNCLFRSKVVFVSTGMQCSAGLAIATTTTVSDVRSLH